MKRVSVIFALPRQQWTWQLELPDAATVGDALQAARGQAVDTAVPWDADVGIFGEPCDRGTLPRDGDRIELYRPLSQDPKESRRARAAARKAAADRASSAAPKPVR